MQKSLVKMHQERMKNDQIIAHVNAPKCFFVDICGTKRKRNLMKGKAPSAAVSIFPDVTSRNFCCLLKFIILTFF